MKVFAHTEEAPRFKGKLAMSVSLLLAAIFILLAVGQLFTFEDFPSVLSGYWILGDQATVHLMAALLVTTEVFTLPFLLRIRVSPLMRITSLACAWFAAIVWLILSLWVVFSANALTNAGLLGATVPLSPGWWQVAFSIALVALVGFMTWNQRTMFRLHATK